MRITRIWTSGVSGWGRQRNVKLVLQYVCMYCSLMGIRKMNEKADALMQTVWMNEKADALMQAVRWMRRLLYIYIFIFYTRMWTVVSKKVFWQRWDSNPRPCGLVPKTSALDHSATLPSEILFTRWQSWALATIFATMSRSQNIVACRVVANFSNIVALSLSSRNIVANSRQILQLFNRQ